AKVYGKLTPKDSLGFLNAIDFGSRNDVIARYRRDLSPTSYAGVFISDKSAPGDSSRVAAVDHSARWGKFSVQSQFAFSGGVDSGGQARQLSVNYEDKIQQYYINFLDLAPTFRIADGLVGFTDFRGVQTFLMSSAQWRKGFWRRYSLFTV